MPRVFLAARSLLANGRWYNWDRQAPRERAKSPCAPTANFGVRRLDGAFSFPAKASRSPSQSGVKPPHSKGRHASGGLTLMAGARRVQPERSGTEAWRDGLLANGPKAKAPPKLTTRLHNTASLSGGAEPARGGCGWGVTGAAVQGERASRPFSDEPHGRDARSPCSSRKLDRVTGELGVSPHTPPCGSGGRSVNIPTFLGILECFKGGEVGQC
jgi:hypothetical protein